MPLAGATIAFDLDGTLVDTARPMIGHGARWLIERGFEGAGVHLHPARAQQLFDRFIAHYRDHLADESRPFPGCEAALDALAADGARLTVCTNKPTALSVAVLDRLGMASRFAAIIGRDSAPAAKPDARHLQAAVAAAGGSMDRAILVGDSATDVGAARAAKAGLILVSFGYTAIPAADLDHDALIDHYDQLPAACLRLLAACGDAS